jgi:hypothetical protein
VSWRGLSRSARAWAHESELASKDGARVLFHSDVDVVGLPWLAYEGTGGRREPLDVPKPSPATAPNDGPIGAIAAPYQPRLIGRTGIAVVVAEANEVLFGEGDRSFTRRSAGEWNEFGGNPRKCHGDANDDKPHEDTVWRTGSRSQRHDHAEEESDEDCRNRPDPFLLDGVGAYRQYPRWFVGEKTIRTCGWESGEIGE